MSTTSLTPAEMGRRGAASAHRPITLARRITKAWPTLPAPERAEVLAELAQITAGTRP